MVRAFATTDREAVTQLWRRAFPDAPPRNQPDRVIQRKTARQADLFLVGLHEGDLVATVLS